MLTVHKKELELAKFASTENRESIECVRLSESETSVTNGAYAIRAKVKRIPSADFPTGKIEPPLKNGAEGGISLKRSDALALAKTLPKKTRIPVLACALVASDGINVEAVTTDLEGATRRGHEANLGGVGYPVLDKVMPSGEVRATVCLDVGNLQAVLDAFKLLGVPAFKLEVRDSDRAIQMTGRATGQDSVDGMGEVTAILMPTKI